MASVSSENITKAVRTILSTADLATLSRKMVRKQLENKFGINMTEYKSIINDSIAFIMEERQNNDDNDSTNDSTNDNYIDNDSNESIDLQDNKDKKKNINYLNHSLDSSLNYNKLPPKKKAKKIITSPNKKLNNKKVVNNNNDNETDTNDTKIKKKRNGGALLTNVVLSPELAELLGKNELSRPQIVKELWKYIHENNLQDPSNRREVILDDKMRKVFQRDSFNMFTMNKYIKRHVRKPEEIALSTNGWNDIERNGESSEEDEEKTKEKERKKQIRIQKRLDKKNNLNNTNNKLNNKKIRKPRDPNAINGLMAPFELSIKMQNFTGEKVCSRPEVVKKLWKYIKENNLQNPLDKKEILCDTILADLLGEEKCSMFLMNKLISPHFLKKVENWSTKPENNTMTTSTSHLTSTNSCNETNDINSSIKIKPSIEKNKIKIKDDNEINNHSNNEEKLNHKSNISLNKNEKSIETQKNIIHDDEDSNDDNDNDNENEQDNDQDDNDDEENDEEDDEEENQEEDDE